MKRMITLLLCGVLLTGLCACSAGDSGQTLYVRDEFSHESMTAIFSDTVTGAEQILRMKKLSEEDGAVIFSVSADPKQFDRVVLDTGSEKTIELAFNEFVSGWQLDSHRVTPYTYGGANLAPDTTSVYLTYPQENNEKRVYIWKPTLPEDVTVEKYSVIYMTDGQNLFDPSATSTGSWGVAESLNSLLALTNEQVMVVGIDNSTGYRDDELTPNLGESAVESYNNGHGKEFCDFVVKTVKPYIESNYPVYTDAAHTAVCGSSSGGIESFYIGMEHPELFGYIGAFSPAFALFDKATWTDYFREKDLTGECPFVYLYTGNSQKEMLEQEMYSGTKMMKNLLVELGYPEDRVVMKIYEDGMHNEIHWRAVFPDFLRYLFADVLDGSAGA